MIFRELILENFGPYRGRHVIDLSPGSNGEAIVLFGGMNGGGKTTLMDAIRLVLYGKRAPCSTRGNLAYSDFLKQCVNRQAHGEPARIELAFLQTLNNAPQPTEFRVCRTWSADLSARGADTLEVLKDEWSDRALAKGWDERIEDLLPLGISSLFLFDGEQVKELAEQDEPPPTVKQAIRNLLGLELPDRLSADLDVLIARKRKTLANPQTLTTLADIEQRLKAKDKERLTARKAVAHAQTYLEKAEANLKEAEETFLLEGGKIAAEKTNLEQQIQQQKAAADGCRQALRELAAGVLPLALVTPLLHQARSQIQTELRQQQLQAAQDLLLERNQRFLEFVRSLSLSTKKLQQLENFLVQEAAALEQSPDDMWLHASPANLQHLIAVLDSSLPSQQQLARDRTQTLQQLLEDIEATERYLATAASEEDYERLRQAVRTAQAEVSKWRTERDRAQQQHDSLARELTAIKRELADYSEAVIDRKNDEHTLRATQKTQKTLERFKQALKSKKLNQLENLVTECFLYLLHKSNLIHRIQIDADSFALSLSDYEGQAIPKHRLSAGEKQLLAIALLWGLARASGRQLPVAIDTPLGRLDSSHRRNLVERYFPQASHQVLLLSTDTEIAQTEWKQLQASGAIAREYLLAYDTGKRQTTVTHGYFWNQC